MLNLIMRYLIIFFALVLTLDVHALEIDLKCNGIGSKAKLMSSNDPNTGQSSTLGYKDESNATVNVYLNESKSWIQIPPHLLPPIKKRKVDNKYKIHDLRINKTNITGKFDINFMNKPKINIDRYTGVLSFKGFGVSFSGECSQVDRSEKKF